MKEEKRLCIGESSLVDRRGEFNNALRELKKVLIKTELEEYGLPFTDEVIKDLILGGIKSHETAEKNLKKELFSAVMLPALRRERQKMFDELMAGFGALCERISNTGASRFRNLAEFYSVSEDGTIYAKQEAYDIMEDETKIYIDKPEQFEVYELASKIISDVARLDELARKYYVTAIGCQNSILHLNFGVLSYSAGAITGCHPDASYVKLTEEKKD